MCEWPLQRLRMRRKRLAEDLRIALVDDGRPCVHKRGHGRSRGRPPILEVVHGIMMQIVRELQCVVRHDIRFLRHGGRDPVSIDPIESLRVLVEADDRDFYVQAMQRFCGSRTSRRF